MKDANPLLLAILLATLAALAPGAVRAAPPVPTIWPLCGRLGEAPGNWSHGQPCTAAAGDASKNDLPIHNGFGYRTYVSQVRPVSLHRGIDLATRAATKDHGLIGNPVFAACAGHVYRITGADPDSDLELKCPQDPLASAQHGAAACAFSPCITVAYRHVRDLRFAVGAVLPIGTHLGYSGETDPNGDKFEHLHFEILDPRERPTNLNGGVTAFSKDAFNPVAYLSRLPRAPSVGVPLEASLPAQNPFAQYASADVGLALEVHAAPGFGHDFESASVEIFRNDGEDGAWRPLAKDEAAIAAGTGGLALPGEYNDGLETLYEVAGSDRHVSSFAPEKLSHLYSPFSANSSLWLLERDMTYFRTLAGSQHPGLDGLTERNAEGKLPAGHRVFDLDMKLIAPLPNPDEGIESDIDPASWWGFVWGLREYGAAIPEPYCVRVELSVLPTTPGAGSARKRVVLARPADTPCPTADEIGRVLRDGFEN